MIHAPETARDFRPSERKPRPILRRRGWLSDSGELYDPLKSAVAQELTRRGEEAPARRESLHAVTGGRPPRTTPAPAGPPQARRGAEALLGACGGVLADAIAALLAAVAAPHYQEIRR